MSHAVVWMDHKEARIFAIDAKAVSPSLVQAPGGHIHRHPKDQEIRVRNHPDDERRFFHEVARALEGDAESCWWVRRRPSCISFATCISTTTRSRRGSSASRRSTIPPTHSWSPTCATTSRVQPQAGPPGLVARCN